MNVNEAAQERIQAARDAMTDMAERNQSALGILYKHFLRSRLELVDGVRAVLNKELEAVEAAPPPAKPAPKSKTVG